MCRKLKLELNDIHNVMISGDKQAISKKITELYLAYDSYSRTSKKIIDKYAVLALELLAKP